MADISTWSKVAANNAETSPDGAQAGWTGSQVGPWARETMAAMRRFYDAQEWSSILEDEAPRGDKTIAYTTASTFTISSVSNTNDSAGYSLTDKLPAGQRIRLRQAAGTSVDYFITSTNLVSTTLTVTVSGNTVANVGYAANGMDVFMTGMTVLAPSIWGGAGNSTARDAQFTAVPATGTTWYDTDTNALQVSDGTAWMYPLTLREAGVDKSKIYYDGTNDRLVLEDGDWASDVGVHGRIYIDDVDGKLYHQTKSAAVTATALSLTPGAGNGLDADKIDGKHLTEVITNLLMPTAANGEGRFELANGSTTILIQFGELSEFGGTLDPPFENYHANGGSNDIYTFGSAYSAIPYVQLNGTPSQKRSGPVAQWDNAGPFYFASAPLNGGGQNSLDYHYDVTTTGIRRHLGGGTGAGADVAGGIQNKSSRHWVAPAIRFIAIGTKV